MAAAPGVPSCGILTFRHRSGVWYAVAPYLLPNCHTIALLVFVFRVVFLAGVKNPAKSDLDCSFSLLSRNQRLVSENMGLFGRQLPPIRNGNAVQVPSTPWCL
jgi:hypothetical protein